MKTTFEQALESIKELEQVLSKLGVDIRNINDLAVESTYLKPADVAKKMGVSTNTAREFMNRPGFPVIRYGSGDRMLVNSIALLLYSLKGVEQ